jgi:UDP-glucose 4-epimerase
MTNKKVAVIGGNGFIGTNLILKLLNVGYEVKSLSRNRNLSVSDPALTQFQVDLEAKTSLRAILEDVDIVFHLAASGPPAESNFDIATEISRNVLPTIHLLEECVSYGVPKLIFLSSGGTVYGDQPPGPIREDAEKHPKSAYAISKLSIEYYLQLYKKIHGLSSVSLRLANPYGPHQIAKSGQGVVAMFFEKLHKGDIIEVWGDGSAVRDFIYIDDVVEALIRVGQSHLEGEFNLGSGQGLSISRILEEVCSSAGLEPRLKLLSSRGVDVSENVLNCEKLHLSLNWQPETPLSMGLRETANWWRAKSTKAQPL